jgi:catechol 2,3-dioxygenase-like lactoylglutathione lyase family enzyme
MGESRAAVVLGIDHVQLPIPFGGAPDARAFYTGVLGLAEVRDPLLQRAGTLRFALPGQRIDLCEGPRSAPPPHFHLALRVVDAEALVRALAAARRRVDGTLQRDGRVYALDPFGNRLEIIATVGVAATRNEVAHG